MESKPDVLSLIKKREDEYEKLAWQMFEDMVDCALEYGRGHSDAINDIAGDLRTKHAYRMGELSGQRELLMAQLKTAFQQRYL